MTSYKQTLKQMAEGQKEFAKYTTIRCNCKAKPRLTMRAGPSWILRCSRCQKPSAEKPTVAEAVKAWNNGEPLL